MFSDIYNFKRKLIGVDFNEYKINPRCIKCGSVDYDIVSRYISSRTTMVRKYKCVECNAIWLVTVNSKFKIIKVEKYI